MKNLILLSPLLFFIACDGSNENPQEIIEKSIAVAGGDRVNNTEIEFVFRDKEYGAMHKDGQFEYVRLFKDSADLVRDELSNEGFKREVNGRSVEVVDSMANKYSNSVNSVIYFALLPIGLDDPAVNTAYIGDKTIGSQAYHKVVVTFDQEGGGEDFQDVFVYWVNKSSNKVDYLAYEYETEGGGMRFREAINERYVGGIRFVDYVNYKPTREVELAAMDEAFINGDLEELSRIELRNIKVNELK